MNLSETDSKNDFEASVLELVKEIIEKRFEDLTRLGLQVKISEIKKHSDSNKYTSEIEIDFWSENNFVDTLEFFVYFEGKQNATLLEIELWVNENINNIIEQLNL